MSKNISKKILILFFLTILFLPIKSDAFEEFSECFVRCVGDSDCESYPDAVCSPKHGYSDIPRMCCHAPCTTDADCPTDEIFYDSEGTDRPRYCLPEGRCARNGDPPPPAPTVGDCTTDDDCPPPSLPDKHYCLLRPEEPTGNICVRCKEDSHCPAGQYCTSSNICEARSERNCCYDSECPETNEICWDEPTTLCALGHCCKVVEGCTSDEDCQGRRCIPGVHSPAHCEKSRLPPPTGSVDLGERCAYPAECSGSYGCIGGGACEGTCGNCTNDDECQGKSVRCEDGDCGAAAGVTCRTDADCENVHGLPGFVCRGGICEPPATPAAPAPPTRPTFEYQYELTSPELEIPLPTLAGLTRFLPAMVVTGELGEERYLVIPWIGEYIAAIYKYIIGITGILAGIMIVIAGVIWLTAGGSAERVSTAKNFIEGAMVGLVIALTSYLLLYAINPNLTEFEALKIKFIERIDTTPVVIEVAEGGTIITTGTAATAQIETTPESVDEGATSCVVLFYTDTHDDPDCQKAVVNAMVNESNVSMILHGGDIADTTNTDRNRAISRGERQFEDDARWEREKNNLWRTRWDVPTEPLHAKWPVYAVTGNHDDRAEAARRFGSLPKKVTCGNVDFFLLPFPGTNISWLQNQLSSSTAQWQVIVTHRPVNYSCREGEKTRMSSEVMQGVDLVLSGHEHVYCRGEKDGITYIIGGTAGNKFRTCVNPQLSECDDSIKLTYVRVAFSDTITIQRKTVNPPSNCNTYVPGN